MPKLRLKNLFSHIGLVLRHKRRVFINCRLCGIGWRGFVHDLSKFSPVELFESARYYTGTRSPIGVCRRENGYSRAWLHHKGVNPHHIEYWFDQDCDEIPMMPYKYAVECACDKLAATRVYAGSNYDTALPLAHWERYGNKAPGNPRTMAFMLRVFTDVRDHGESYVLNKEYMTATYTEICGEVKPKKA